MSSALDGMGAMGHLLIMTNASRHAALLLALSLAGAASFATILKETTPKQAPERAEAWRNRRYIAQSEANPSRWEALEVMAHDPGSFVRTELTPAQARRWMEDGGFERLSAREYWDVLLIADSYRKGREMARSAEERRVPVRVAAVE